MLMNAVLAVALGLAPEGPVIHYRTSDYGALIGRYSQSVDKLGTTRLRGFDRLTGKPFDIAVAKDGRARGNVGDMFVDFTISERG